MVWAGRILSWLAAAFLLLDGIMKLVQPPAVVQGTTALGYAQHHLAPIGIILLTSTVLYLVPNTTILGAILLTGYLGGAVASNLRVDNPLLLYTLFPVYFGIVLWLGIYLRNERLRALVPLVSKSRTAVRSSEELRGRGTTAA